MTSSTHISHPLCHCQHYVGAAVTAAMAAMLSPPLPQSPLPLPLLRLPPSPPSPAPFLLPLLPLLGWLLFALALPRLRPPLPVLVPLLAADAIATVVAAANRCPLLLPQQPRDVQNITFKVIFEHLCCHFLVDCYLSLCWLCFCHCCLSPPLCIRQPFHRCHDKHHQHRELPVLDDNVRVKVEVQNITFTKETFWTSNMD